ncbi:Protein-S-isoprenylcysteine O-methyltransferase [Abortiporus biennis]
MSPEFTTGFKIILLLINGISTHISLSPPTAPIQKKEYATSRETLFERRLQGFIFLVKTVHWMFTISSCLVTYFAYQASNPTIGRDNQSQVVLSYLYGNLSPASLSSTSKILSSMFTLELTIQPKHKLITQGPYAYVRHPSYTGMYLTILGTNLVYFTPGSWIYLFWLKKMSLTAASDASKIMGLGLGTSVTAVGIFWVIVHFGVLVWWSMSLYTSLSIYQRTFIEDAELKKLFGKTWDEYAKQVQWRLIPGIL